MFLFKQDKPLWKRLGLHHAALMLGALIVQTLVGGLAVVLLIGYHYWVKEKRENGKDFEIFDFATPVLLGLLYNFLLYLNRMT